MALTDDIRRVVDESSNKLRQRAAPPVKYWLLSDVFGKDREDIVLQNALEECGRYPPKLKLLGRLRSDGTWPISKEMKWAEDAGRGPPIGETHRTMLFNLQTLSEYGTTIDEGNVRASLEKILSWQTDEGYIPGPWTDAFPLPHFNGHAAHRLHSYSMVEDVRVKKLVRWLLKMQRHDGGWNIPYEMDVHYLPEYRAMRINDFREFIRTTDRSQFDLRSFTKTPSCIWCTMLAVWGLSRNPALASSEEVRRGAEFFLDRFFKRNPHPNFYVAETHWTRLGYPMRFGNGLLALALLTRMGYGQSDPRMEKPIRWLLSQRSQDGFWTQTGRPNATAEQWITLNALRVLKMYSDLP